MLGEAWLDDFAVERFRCELVIRAFFPANQIVAAFHHKLECDWTDFSHRLIVKFSDPKITLSPIAFDGIFGSRIPPTDQIITTNEPDLLPEVTVVRYAELQLEDGQGLGGRLADDRYFAVKFWQERLDLVARDGKVKVWSAFYGLVRQLDGQVFINISRVIMIPRRAHDLARDYWFDPGIE